MALFAVFKATFFLNITVPVGIRKMSSVEGAFRADSNGSSNGRDSGSSRFGGSPSSSLSSTKARGGLLLLGERFLRLTHVLV